MPYVPGVNWAKGIDMKTGRPIVNPEANYSKTGKGALVSPFFGGAHNWQPLSFSPHTGLVYIPANQSSYAFVATHEDDNPDGPEAVDQLRGQPGDDAQARRRRR